nr:hypothetical protein [Tanacetum cinerariifolium]
MMVAAAATTGTMVNYPFQVHLPALSTSSLSAVEPKQIKLCPQLTWIPNLNELDKGSEDGLMQDDTE